MTLGEKKGIVLIVALAPIATSLLMCGLLFGVSFLQGEYLTERQMIGGFAMCTLVFYIGYLRWYWRNRHRELSDIDMPG